MFICTGHQRVGAMCYVSSILISENTNWEQCEQNEPGSGTAPSVEPLTPTRPSTVWPTRAGMLAFQAHVTALTGQTDTAIGQTRAYGQMIPFKYG